jgi:hypothetical protein
MSEPLPQVPFKYIYRSGFAAWRMAKSQYKFILLLSLAYIGVMGLEAWIFRIYAIPQSVATQITTLISSLFVPAFLLMGKNWAEGIKAKFSDIFILFHDRELLGRYWPVILISMLVGLPSGILLTDPDRVWTPLFWLTVAYAVLVSFAIFFLPPIVIFKKLPLGQSVVLSVRAYYKNFFQLLWGGICLGVTGIRPPQEGGAAPLFIERHPI